MQHSTSSKEFKSHNVEQKLNQVLLNNTHIVSSEICGLGKTEKIKNKIKNDKKEYMYFPLGGKLSRNIIFKKVEQLLKKVKDSKNTAIHLDLYEADDTSILNEFLFSFCFTKFYSNEENVLYIPINIEIYIEIPNCFIDFLENYPILNYFKIDKITFKEKEPLKLDNETIKFFNWMLPEERKENNRFIKPSPEEYIYANLGAKKFCYHQINNFIKLYLAQYKMDNAKLRFIDKEGKDVTKKCIEDFAKCTRYFTLGVYATFLTKNLEEEKEDVEKMNKNLDVKNTNNCESIIESNVNINVSFSYLKAENNSNNNNNNVDSEEQNEINLIDYKSINSKTKKDEEIKNKIVDFEDKRNDYLKKLSITYENDLNDEKYEVPLIFIIKNTNMYKKVTLTNDKLSNYDTTNYLDEIKTIFQLKNPVDKEKDSNVESLMDIIEKDNYVITVDNYRKMLLISYRILADIPVILMGETGCGKTGLIRKLYQLLNNGEDMDPKKNMINVDSSIDDEKLIEKMNIINKEASKNTKKDFWVLFDEINTCNSLGLLKEIFINRTYYGIKLEKNIRLIGTCNPYREKTEEEESSGLSHPFKNKNLAYDVNILPQSLMFFVFNFGSLRKDDEDKYIESILINHFKDFEKGLINIVAKIISECHVYLRKLYGTSIVSLREIKRFLKLYDNLMKYYNYKDNLELNKINEEVIDKKKRINKKCTKNDSTVTDPNTNIKNKLNQIKSIIVTIYLSYYIRLVDQKNRTAFESHINPNLQDLANYYEKEQKCKKDNNNAKNDLSYPLGIKWKPLIEDYRNFKVDNNQSFGIFFENECDYIINKIDLEKGIAKNRILKENIFLQFIAVTSNIPLIIIGKPGSSKSLSYQQLKKSMKGNISKNIFFRKYPKILETYFQGSESTLAEDIENLFEEGKRKLINYKGSKEEKPISLLIFDEIGLSEYAKDNPVKVLHKNLEYDGLNVEGVEDGLSFIGFSNWKLDLSKLNRVLYLSVPDLDTQYDDLYNTSKCIAESIKGEKNTDNTLLELICKSYEKYQDTVKKIKEYVVYKELEEQEMKQVLESLSQDKIKEYFNKEKKLIDLDDFKGKRNEIIKDKTKKNYSWFHGNFSSVKEMNEYKIIYAKNRRVNPEFHGNRDFYNYNKGIFSIKPPLKNLDDADNKISEEIEKVIERNFGGVDICIDIDYKMNDNDQNNDENGRMKRLKDIINQCPNAKKNLKIPSVYLFKYIYNEQLNSKIEESNNCDDKDDYDNKLKIEKYKINENNLIKYNLIRCINENINDNDARYLLLEIEEELKYLVWQNIISQKNGKNITYMEGSPFINDIKDKNGEYKIKKISEIQNYCNNEMVLILSNLDQIYAFLYDFFNRNPTISDKKKYSRICQGNFTEQLTYIADNFRIIIMINKSSIDRQESPFLNRFEKAIVKFEELLGEKDKASSKRIFDDLRIKTQIEKVKTNYNINNLLINYDETSIDRLYFYYSNKKENINFEEIKKKIFEKIAKTIPQDIIVNLNFEKNNIMLKEFYNKKRIFNFKDYLEYLNGLNAKEKDKINISIIYTFSSIISTIDTEEKLDNNSQQIISEIKRENDLIELINERKIKNKRIFIMHFYQNELDKINFIISTLKNNYKDGNFKFFLIVHIKRFMDGGKKEKIYSIPDIDEKVDQIFIDNLNGLPISLSDIEEKGIIGILENKELINISNEFNRALKEYYNSYTDRLNFIEKYVPKLIKYFEENKEFMDLILSKAFDLLKQKNKNKAKDENSFDNIRKEIFENSYITHNTIDIVSTIINNVIIEKRLRRTIIQILDALAADNFLTTLLTLDNNNKVDESFSSKDNLLQILKIYLDTIKIKDIKKNAIFEQNYLIPGLLSFYDLISNFISKNIVEKFFKNEKKLRVALKGDSFILKSEFHKEEDSLLNIVIEEIKSNDESDDYKFINSIIEKCPYNLLLNDYIIYFLNKYYYNNEKITKIFDELSENERDISSNEEDEEDPKEDEVDNFYEQIIKKILDIKYQDNTEIIKMNEGKEFNKFLIKIIWLEANKDYILTIIQLYSEAINKIYRNKNKNIFLEQINNLIKEKKIQYISDENRNPKHTTEVNECFYIILGNLYSAITDLDIVVLFDPNNNRDSCIKKEKQVKVQIDSYLKCLSNIVTISQPFNDMLYIFSNELYIIVNLNKIINLLTKQKNKYTDVEIVKKIIKNLIESISLFRENKLQNFTRTTELKNNLDELINIISENILNKDKEYYSLLRYIILQEIKKISDKNYRLNIFKSYLINEKEMLLYSNQIFDILLRGKINPNKGKFLVSLENFKDKGDDIVLVIENAIKNKKKEYISHIMMYYFEKLSHVYLDNYFKSKIEKKNEKNLLEKEPLDIFKNCLNFLSDLNNINIKIKNVYKLFCVGYIRVYLYKFEEYIRNKSSKINNPIDIINSINSFKKPISSTIELFYYKIIYYKNKKDINYFYSKNHSYNIESLNNYKEFFRNEINNDNSEDEIGEKNNNSIINILEEKDNQSEILNNNIINEFFYYSDYIDEEYLSSIIKDKDEDYPVLSKYLELKRNDNILNNFYIYNKALVILNENYTSKITRERAKRETLEKQIIYNDNKDLFNKFFEIYKKLSDNINNDNNDDDNENEDNDDNDDKINDKNNQELNQKMPLMNFLIVDDNKFSENYKNIYEQFIDKHNEIVESLLKAKSKNYDEENQNKINIQNITKEDEIFITKKDFSFQIELFNYSYRKVIIKGDYSEFNKYEINLDFIEEMLTNKLLNNKKLINKDIFNFNFKNEDLEFENKNICTKFQEKFKEEKLIINDKIIFYEYFKQNEKNINLHLKLLNDFSYLIIYSHENFEKLKEIGQTKINELLKDLEIISDESKEIFKDKDNLTINKLINIYEYYQILCFIQVKNNLKNYQEKTLDKEKQISIENYIENHLNKNKDEKNHLETALRRFIICFLAKEKNKENKIKLNKNNITNYLDIEDLWSKDFYKEKEFDQSLKILKNLNIKINNVILFYNKCFSNTYKNYFDDVKDELKKREEERARKEEEKEKEDIRNFNPDDKNINVEQEEEIKNQEKENSIENNDDDNNSALDDSIVNEGDDEENNGDSRY